MNYCKKRSLKNSISVPPCWLIRKTKKCKWVKTGSTWQKVSSNCNFSSPKEETSSWLESKVLKSTHMITQNSNKLILLNNRSWTSSINASSITVKEIMSFITYLTTRKSWIFKLINWIQWLLDRKSKISWLKAHVRRKIEIWE